MASPRSVLTVAAIFSTLLLSVIAGSASKCKGDQSSPHDSSRTGGALLQAHVDKDGVGVDEVRESGAIQASKTTGMPLKGRVAGVEAAVAELKSRMSTLQTEVSGTSDIEGGAPIAAISTSAKEDTGEDFPTLDLDTSLTSIASTRAAAKHNGGARMVSDSDDDDTIGAHAKRKLSLMASSSKEELNQESAEEAEALKQDPTLKERVAVLERDLADLKSKMSTLENEVMGTTFAMKMSLLQEGGSALKSRIVSVEEAVDSLRSRVSTLEHSLVG